ncbi:Mannose-specific lectin [Acorus gramineus]|uniref:Mannose-specific lectin n=1 Tax=Acorus gramineus TaxID=55184 RepID=A0AAV9A730_ACOGR|nr:Mannose-specific lectin [Acorus gramineus]
METPSKITLPLLILLLLAISLGLIANPCDATTNILYSGQRLSAGQSLREGNYRLLMQSNCNLVLYNGDYILWSTGTQYMGTNCYLTVTYDARLIVYDSSGRPVWTSDTYRAGRENYVLILQTDGSLVLYGPEVGRAYNARNTVTDTTAANAKSVKKGTFALVP